MAKPIEMPFGFCTRLAPGYHVEDRVQIPPHVNGAILEGSGQSRTFLDMSGIDIV